MTETFYDVLGVPPDATTEAIETAYREAVKEVHPDVSDDTDASRRTKRLNKAKRVLTDDEERARYDRLGHGAYVDGTPSSGAGPADDPSGPEDASTRDGSAADRRAANSRSGRSGGPNSTSGAASSTGASGGNGSGGRGRRSTRRGRSTDQDGSSGRGGSNDGARSTGGESSGRERADGRNRRDGERSKDGDRPGDGERSRDRSGSAGEADASRAGNATTRSRADSTGPSWQRGQRETTESRSARRQAAAGGTDGPNVDWSWNSWSPQDAWAVRRSEADRELGLARLFPPDQSVVLLASTFFCYPFFVGSVLFPPFPLVVRATVAVCTVLMFAYLLSMPEVAILVYGSWAVVATLGLLLVPSVGPLSLAGVVALTTTWVPLGISVLTFSILRP